MSYRATAYEKLLREIVDDIDRLRATHLALIDGVDPKSAKGARVVGLIGLNAVNLIENIHERAEEVLRRD